MPNCGPNTDPPYGAWGIRNAATDSWTFYNYERAGAQFWPGARGSSTGITYPRNGPYYNECPPAGSSNTPPKPPAPPGGAGYHYFDPATGKWIWVPLPPTSGGTPPAPQPKPPVTTPTPQPKPPVITPGKGEPPPSEDCGPAMALVSSEAFTIKHRFKHEDHMRMPNTSAFSALPRFTVIAASNGQSPVDFVQQGYVETDAQGNVLIRQPGTSDGYYVFHSSNLGPWELYGDGYLPNSKWPADISAHTFLIHSGARATGAHGDAADQKFGMGLAYPNANHAADGWTMYLTGSSGSRVWDVYPTSTAGVPGSSTSRTFRFNSVVDINRLTAAGNVYPATTVSSNQVMYGTGSGTLGWSTVAALGAGTFQPLDALLTALSANTGRGIVSLDGDDTYVNRSIAVATGFAIADASGEAGNPTISFAIQDLTEDTTPVITTDYFLEYDASAGAHKKTLLKNALYPLSVTPSGGVVHLANIGDWSSSGEADFGIGHAAQLIADQPAWSGAASTFVGVDSDATRTIDGMAVDTAGTLNVLYNRGAEEIVLADESSLATAPENRITNVVSAPFYLVPDATVFAYYDSENRWRTKGCADYIPHRYGGSPELNVVGPHCGIVYDSTNEDVYVRKASSGAVRANDNWVKQLNAEDIGVSVQAAGSYQAADSDLTALAALSTTGMMARTAANTYTMRTITASASNNALGISVSNGDGVSGNPTIGFDIVGRTALTAIALDDVFPIYDLSTTTNKKITPVDLLEVLNLLPADGTPDGAADYVLAWDNSAGTVVKVLMDNLPGGSGTLDIDAYSAMTAAIVPGTDVLAISDGGTESKITYAYLMSGVDQLPNVAALANGDIFLVIDASDAAPKANHVTYAALSSAIVGDVPAASDTVAGLIEYAVETEMESASSNTRAVTPGRQHFHPGHCKIVTTVDGDGVGIEYDYGVNTITDTAVGDMTVNYDTSFATTDYCVQVSCERATGSAWADQRIVTVRTGGKATGSVRCICYDTTNTGHLLADPVNWFVCCWGLR